MKLHTPNVLVVDDDQNIRELLTEWLTILGYRPILAGSAEEAAGMIQKDNIDIILLDLRLPGVPGHAFLRQLREQGMTLPVVAISGAGTMDDIITLLRTGIDDYLQKPLDMQTLSNALARVSQRKQSEPAPKEEAPQPPSAAPEKNDKKKRSKTSRPRSLVRKLSAMYALMFVIPMMYMGWLLTSTSSNSTPNILVGIGAAVLLSLGAFLMMYRSQKSIRAVTQDAESLIQQSGGGGLELPPSDDEAERISHCLAQLVGELKQKTGDIDRYASELKESNRKLSNLAMRDGLTGMFNQTCIKQRLSVEFDRAKRFGHSLTLLMLDIDDFKNYNDTYGHLMGDTAIREIARLISEQLRSTDIAARYGGEEFLVLFPETDGEDILGKAEAIRNSISQHPFHTDPTTGKKAHLTVSVGLATRSENTGTPEDLLTNADNHLYEAKKSGKDKVCS